MWLMLQLRGALKLWLITLRPRLENYLIIWLTVVNNLELKDTQFTKVNDRLILSDPIAQVTFMLNKLVTEGVQHIVVYGICF